MNLLNFSQVTFDLVKWIEKRVEESHCKGVVFGLSGGIDSSIVAVLCQKAMGENILGLIMSCGTSRFCTATRSIRHQTFKFSH